MPWNLPLPLVALDAIVEIEGKDGRREIALEDLHHLPGATPERNLQFLVFLMAVLKGVHRRAGLLRAAIASAGNDHRLGANEAPPAIISVFLGDQLTRVLDAIDEGVLPTP